MSTSSTGDRPDEPDEPDEIEEASELERTIGLSGAVTIGTGTMIGAGIFVFPGLAAGRAGPGAALSFLIGAVVALLVALPTIELATAMPRSGGGYFHVSRGLGAFTGSIIGIGLVFGLVFAAAFYLVGFGEYLVAILTELGLRVDLFGALEPLSAVSVLAVVAAGGLTITGILGTEKVEGVQNTLVGLLLAILVVFLIRGGVDVLGLVGTSRVPRELLPYGYGAILSTAALIFTSYLGFAQVATVAGEVVDPDRTLPLAILGSVLLVAVLYAVTVFIAASTFDPAVLAELGETAIVAVARTYLGAGGALAILVAGFLATLSSANASVLSGSRTLYSLSQDGLVPERAGRVNQRYGTPHFALGFVGGVAVTLVVAGPIELLAEVASFLHLLLYGMTCVVQVVLSRSDPEWYDPGFVCPGTPFVPIGGVITSGGLLLFMQPLSQGVGLALVGFAVAWYYLYAPDVELQRRLH